MTIQDPEAVLYQGRELFTDETPLKSLPKKFGFNPESEWTANWRGYVGTWKVEGGNLYLIGIDVHNGCGGPLYELLGRHGGTVLADWYSGRIEAAGTTRQGLVRKMDAHESLLLIVKNGVVEYERYERCRKSVMGSEDIRS